MFTTRKALKAQIANLQAQVKQAERANAWSEFRAERLTKHLHRSNPTVLENPQVREYLLLSPLSTVGNTYNKAGK